MITYWTLDELMQIENETYKAAKSVGVVDGNTVTNIDGTAILTSEKLAMALAVKKMTSAEGEDIPVSYEVIGNLHGTDGTVIREEVEKVVGDVKKK